MGPRAGEYRAQLQLRSNLDQYLKANSGLPGPRANLELVTAVGDVADAATLWRLSASDDEFPPARCWRSGSVRMTRTSRGS